MQQIKIPQSPFVTQNGMVATEWLVFLNELIRLGNQIISKDTINKADDSEFNNIMQPTFIGWDMADAQSVDSSVALKITEDDNPDDNPYAQLATTLQLIHDQQIWDLTV